MGNAREVTVGIDIGTTSVKALAVDGDGTVLARARVPHERFSPEPDQFQHDPDIAWKADVLEAYRQVGEGLEVAAVNVAAMVPSMCAVDEAGNALTPGLLYGDARGGQVTGKNPSESGEFVNYVRWCAAQAPDAAGYWPAQAMANHALTGVAAIDSVVAMTALPLFDFTGWDPALMSELGISVDQLPTIVPGSAPIGETADGVLVGGGTVDAFGEQLVAGADNVGDALVICGATLVMWAVVPDWIEVPGLWTVPHTAPGKILIGGASNAGGLFLDWALALIGNPGPDLAPHPTRVPVWEPYVRGERTPLHDASRRAVLHDLDLTHGPAEVRRAAYESCGFVLRHHFDLAGVSPQRIVATGGGVRVAEWMQALADCTGIPVDVVAVPEGGALGTAYLSRVTAGLEPDASGAGRWAATDHRVEPDPAWHEAASARYERFLAYTGYEPEA